MADPTPASEPLPLTPAQQLALDTLAARPYCVLTRRASHVGKGWVNYRAGESLRQRGLARFSMDYGGERISITDAGRAIANANEEQHG